MFTCYNCGDITRIPTLYKDNLYLCDRCYRLTKLPTLVLTKRWFSDTLFNPQTGKYLRVTEESLQGCGFTLYNKKVFLYRAANDKFQEIRVYRYFGNFGCQLLHPQDFGRFQISCQSRTCF